MERPKPVPNTTGVAVQGFCADNIERRCNYIGILAKQAVEWDAGNEGEDDGSFILEQEEWARNAAGEHFTQGVFQFAKDSKFVLNGFFRRQAVHQDVFHRNDGTAFWAAHVEHGNLRVAAGDPVNQSCRAEQVKYLELAGLPELRFHS